MKRTKNISEGISLGVSFHTLPRNSKDKAFNIREVFVCEKDEWFVTADFKAMELRVLAHISQDKNMIQMFKSGVDPHKYTASLVYGKSADLVTPEERQIAKSGSFLIVYGGGPWKLSKTCNISLKVAESVIDKLKQVYPSVFDWMEVQKDKIYEKHYCTSLFGRRRNLPDITSHVEKIRDKCIRQGVNFVIQNTASDITCYAVIDIAKEFKFRGLTSKIVGTVHDSIEVITKKPEVDETLQIIWQKMKNYPLLRSFGYDLSVPLDIEVEVGQGFGSGKEIKFSDRGSVLNLNEL